jgi:predicted CopG family antitoxin
LLDDIYYPLRRSKKIKSYSMLIVEMIKCYKEVKNEKH